MEKLLSLILAVREQMDILWGDANALEKWIHENDPDMEQADIERVAVSIKRMCSSLSDEYCLLMQKSTELAVKK